MARYHLHLHNSIGFVRDEEGAEFQDLEEARSSAVDSVRSILCEEVEQGVIDLRGWIDIADPGGDLLASIRFAEAVELRLDGEES